jgi:hypothetical protein
VATTRFYAAFDWCRVQEIRASRLFFARCGIPRTLTVLFMGPRTRVQGRGIPHLAKNKRDVQRPAPAAGDRPRPGATPHTRTPIRLSRRRASQRPSTQHGSTKGRSNFLNALGFASLHRHPERSASQIYRVTQRLVRGVEGPRRCLSYPCCLELLNRRSPHRAD